jgi:hypothetical protein
MLQGHWVFYHKKLRSSLQKKGKTKLQDFRTTMAQKSDLGLMTKSPYPKLRLFKVEVLIPMRRPLRPGTVAWRLVLVCPVWIAIILGLIHNCIERVTVWASNAMKMPI